MMTTKNTIESEEYLGLINSLLTEFYLAQKEQQYSPVDLLKLAKTTVDRMMGANSLYHRILFKKTYSDGLKWMANK